MPSDATDLKRLLDSPETVTHFLETLMGEVLVAEVVRQYPVAADSDNPLGVTVGQAMTRRISVLKGRATDVSYLYADSIFVPERLPEEVWAQLERSSDPIGRVLVAHGLKLGRVPLPPPGRFGAKAPGADVEFATEIVWSRAYRLTIDGQPMFAIREWFLRSVLDAIDRQARS
jgi:chorismate-pyruvate lyase